MLDRKEKALVTFPIETRQRARAGCYSDATGFRTPSSKDQPLSLDDAGSLEADGLQRDLKMTALGNKAMGTMQMQDFMRRLVIREPRTQIVLLSFLFTG